MRYKDANILKDIDPKYYEKLAQIESSGNPYAKAKTSSAAGLFQFTESTWKDAVNSMNKPYTLKDRFDPDKSREVVAYFTEKNKNYLQRVTGKEPNQSELYLAHFLGSGGARDLINNLSVNPNTPVDQVLSEAAIKANKSIFLNKNGKAKTVKDVYNWSAKKFGTDMWQISAEDISNNKPTHSTVVDDYATIPEKEVDNTNVYTPPTKDIPQVVSGDLSSLENTSETPIFKTSTKPAATTKVDEAKQNLQNKQSELDFLLELIGGVEVPYVGEY